MIEETKGYKTSDGEIHLTKHNARVHILSNNLDSFSDHEIYDHMANTIAKKLLENIQELMPILTEEYRESLKKK